MNSLIFLLAFATYAFAALTPLQQCCETICRNQYAGERGWTIGTFECVKPDSCVQLNAPGAESEDGESDAEITCEAECVDFQAIVDRSNANEEISEEEAVCIGWPPRQKFFTTRHKDQVTVTVVIALLIVAFWTYFSVSFYLARREDMNS
eukprot:TRINITY_DN6059_c0_g1_i1.p2 TRINITY_DN6059_c0_g1~~TRINITY_DN6059_c0_g1_i1.p2  ORF type:complete len:150 (-),score=57.48 TRINITY_DN6059_c0_g1_i1:76-525(-)